MCCTKMTFNLKHYHRDHPDVFLCKSWSKHHLSPNHKRNPSSLFWSTSKYEVKVTNKSKELKFAILSYILILLLGMCHIVLSGTDISYTLWCYQLDITAWLNYWQALVWCNFRTVVITLINNKIVLKVYLPQCTFGFTYCKNIQSHSLLF